MRFDSCVGNRENTSIWIDPRSKGGTLCSRFRRLFELCSSIFVAEIRREGMGFEGNSWRLRRRLFCMEGRIDSLMCFFVS